MNKYINAILFYLKSDLIKKQRDFKIGLLSVFLVVFFLTLLLNAIQLAPCIFIKIGEKQSGETDLILTPYLKHQNVETKKSGFDSFFYNKEDSLYSNISNITNLNFLNYYEIKEKLSNLSFIEGISPRWFFLGKASNNNNNTDKNESIEFKTNIIILDSSIENNIGLGRTLNLPELKVSECYISNTLSNALKVKPGDQIQMEIRLLDLIKAYSDKSTSDSNSNGEDFFHYFEDYAEEMDLEGDYDYIQEHFKGNLKDKYEKEDDIDNFNIDNIINFNPINDFKLQLNLNDTNKDKGNKNNILNYRPLKPIIINIVNEYINTVVVDYIDKSMKLFNQIFPNKINYKNLTNFIIKKNDLMLLVNDIPYAKDLLNNFFTSDDNLEKTKLNNENTFKNIINLLLKKIIIYNKRYDLIYFNRTLIKELSSGNLTNFIEDNIDYDSLLNEDNNISDNITQYFNIKLNLTIKGKVKSTDGKWPDALGNVLAIDSKHIRDYLYINTKRIMDDILKVLGLENMDKIIWKNIDNYIRDFDIYNYALTLNIIFKDKFGIYEKDEKKIRHYISKITEDITSSLGVNSKVNIKTPVYKFMVGLNNIKVFLYTIFFGIMFFLWLISIILVNSLMSGNVDERTYEFGMMRALGFQKDNLILLIFFKGIIFAVPGVFLGLSTSYIINNYIAFLFNWYSGLVMPFSLSTVNILFGIICGISIPLVSSIYPIRKSLNNNLRDSLTLFNNKKIGDIMVSMIKLEKLGISTSTLIASITLIIIGLLTYYAIPFCFYQNNLFVFSFIMLVVLILMVFGLIFLSFLLVPIINKILLKIILFFSFKDRKFHLIILRNIDSHKRRDRQISLMFIVAISFLVFSGCTLNLVVDCVEEISKKFIGGDFSIYAFGHNKPNITLDEISINSYLKNISKNYPDLIKDYAYNTYSLKEIMSAYDLSFRNKLSSFNGYPLIEKDIAGIDKSYIESSYSFLYSVTEYDKKINKSYTNGKIDIVKMLYNNRNIPSILQEKNITFIHPLNKKLNYLNILKNFQINIFESEGIKKLIGINTNNPAQLRILQSPEHSIPCKIVGFASKLPGSYAYSSYEFLSRQTFSYTSNEEMKKLVDIESQIYNINLMNLSNVTVDGVRKRRIILKFNDNASKELREMVFFAMNNYLEGLNTFNAQVIDITNISEEVKVVVEYIILVMGIIAFILSFFLIWISFYSNIRENIAEYGIMRSIGITKIQNIRIYLYEASTIVITSIIIGSILGIFISCSLILQFDLFLELPFILNFPYKLYFILVIIGLFLGLLGSYYPIYDVNKLSLVKIMKGFNY